MLRFGCQLEGAVALAGVGAAEDHARALLLGASHTADDQRAFGAEQVAVGPARLDAKALAGAVSGGRRDHPRRPRFLVDRDRDLLGAVRSRQPGAPRLDRDRLEQAGGDQRLAQVVDLPAVVELARLEPREHADVIGAERLLAGADDVAIAAARADRHRQGIERAAGLRIEQYVALADFGERIGVFGQRQRDLGFGAEHARGDHRLAGIERQVAADQVGRERRCGLDDDVGIGEALARRDIEHRGQWLSVFGLRPVDPGGDLRVEPALGGEQFLEQRAVLADPAGQLGEVGGAALAAAQRRAVIERIGEIGVARLVGAGEAVDLHAVADLDDLAVILGFGESHRGDLEAFQRRQRPCQLRIADRPACRNGRFASGDRRTARRRHRAIRRGPGRPPCDVRTPRSIRAAGRARDHPPARFWGSPARTPRPARWARSRASRLRVAAPAPGPGRPGSPYRPDLARQAEAGDPAAPPRRPGSRKARRR